MLIKMVANPAKGIIEPEEDPFIDPEEIEHHRKLISPEESERMTQFDSVYPKQAYAIFGTWVRLWLCCGVGYGKTFTGRLWLYNHMRHRSPRGRLLICANTREQLTSAVLPPVFEMFHKLDLEHTVHKIPPRSWGVPRVYDSYKNVLCVLIEPGVVAQILLRSLVNFAAIKGIELEGAWCDEFADAPLDGIDVICDRLRGRRTSYPWPQFLLTGSPQGENAAWERFKPENNDIDPALGNRRLHEVVFASATENVVLAKERPDYFDNQRKTYDPITLKQQQHGRIVSVTSGQTYYAFRQEACELKYPYNPDKPLEWTWDFNTDDGVPLSSLLCQTHNNWEHNELHGQVLREVGLDGSNIEAVMNEAFKDPRVRNHRGGFRVFGDATQDGKSATQSDYWTIVDKLENFFDGVNAPLNEIEMFVPTCNPRVRNRIRSVNAVFENGHGRVRVWINEPECPRLVNDLRRIVPGRNAQNAQAKLLNKSKKRLTHFSDALGYWVYQHWPYDMRDPGYIRADWRGRR